MITFFVRGVPKTKGSLIPRHRWGPMVNGRPTCVIGLTESMGKELAWWRSRVKEMGEHAMLQGGYETLATKVYLGIAFYFPLDAQLFGHRRHDIDKLVRAVMDALTDAKVYTDDSWVSQLEVHKTYMDARHPAGAAICLDLMP